MSVSGASQKHTRAIDVADIAHLYTCIGVQYSGGTHEHFQGSTQDTKGSTTNAQTPKPPHSLAHGSQPTASE